MKPRAAWPILAKKAKEKCDQAMAALVKGREKIKGLEQSRGRMEALYADYLARSIAAEKKSLSIQESVNFRGFLQQIQTLIKRVDVDLQHAKFELDVLKGNLLAAEKKRIQMETLQEQDERRIREATAKREQREMDAAGVMLFNMK
ncbi:MAG: flagellar export protein FliJ [Burkholderiales bacterium]|jgi:flagellar export protein FliJ|nr:flagellar export protein FliJ [Burkholderiales bacterium]